MSMLEFENERRLPTDTDSAPKLYRSMKADNVDGVLRPALGQSASTLGIRFPKDIAPSERGDVNPGQKGMSVVSRIDSLDPRMIPKRLRAFVRGASGRNSICLWRMNKGVFRSAPINDDLLLRLKPHDLAQGYVEQSRKMSKEAYLKAVQSTQVQWEMCENELS